MDDIKKMLFLNQKFNILALKANVNTTATIGADYAYAWSEGVYPLFDEGLDWHKPYGEFFDVTEEMMDELSKLLDDHWMSNKPITFYELEDHYKVRQGTTHWDRPRLIHACRYMFLCSSFSEAFWATLCENGKCPSEAHSIPREFSSEDIYLG
ncbi:hypothetical protein [Parendozoicomonas haliclonae]|uniref:Uncharacterized protein n=1 Tax=Parendozoicomonas haliclonae TaxID=1960125 RepID=A0A1X7AKK6_9GAMM|nr:hypothetical protein [Parendozoicomonas haliclonae]SMA47384.1 hypothetical protein EHSB41UT_02398 [Parendozoicomonas haliclonae]